MPATARQYHHGDLPSALVQAALELLEEDGTSDLSLRAVARRAGVSTAAPYRHFVDREALVSAVAAIGYTELAEQLVEASAEPRTPDELAEVAVAYVRFALDRPGLFRVMFTEGCDSANPNRTVAVEGINAYLRAAIDQAVISDDPDSLATATWALVHGLAFLHLDGKLDASSPTDVAARVKAAVRAVVGLSVPSAAS